MGAIFVNDEKIRLELEFRDYELVDGVEVDNGALDISSGNVSEITFLFERPDGTAAAIKKLSTTKVVVPVGTDGKAHYDTETGFLNQAGRWRIQGFVELTSGVKARSVIVDFPVGKVLVAG